MTVRVAIHGLGRIGRLVLRALYESKRQDVQIVAIGDWGEPESALHLLRYDSVHGRFPCSLELNKSEEGELIVDGIPIPLFVGRSPCSLPWKRWDVDVVLECSGRLNTRDKAAQHLVAGAKKVLVSAPADGADITVVWGVNHNHISPEHCVVSNASCTTNCLAPLVQILHDSVGIFSGCVTTVHAYTGDQNLVDRHHKDPRRSRAAALSMIPSSTGAARALDQVLPELAGRIVGTAIRVPVPNVSLIDLTFVSERNTTIDEIHRAVRSAAEGPLRGIVDMNTAPLVSCDFNHHEASCVFDTTQTQVVQETLCRVLSWYDNEWGFSNRMLDVATYMGKT